ncbi:MAG: glucose-1-phosphate adenylyltransferase subunit GlgD, partial [Parasporobacterium sp.]|nr:glucose-1-phosphate adenylyltransferase subunit GlgD [Parasporobacterium sp.]
MKKTIGLISANYSSKAFGELLSGRSLASLPFGGRYRLVDFTLSNMVNSGITTLGIVAPHDFRSLIDHIGTGKDWGLDRKIGGMFVLPGAVSGVRPFNNRFLLRDIIASDRFLVKDQADYVLFCGTNKVCNIDYRPIIEAHEKSGCVVTIGYYKENYEAPRENLFLSMDSEGVLTDITFLNEGEVNIFADCIVINREFLLYLIETYGTADYKDIMEIIYDASKRGPVNTYEFKGYFGSVDDPASYVKVSMDLLNDKIKDELFNPDRPIFTKVQDEFPTIYKDTAKVKNSLVSAGCIIEGEVENCIIFRSCHIMKGAKIKNSVIMQHGTFENDCVITNAVFDK